MSLKRLRELLIALMNLGTKKMINAIQCRLIFFFSNLNIYVHIFNLYVILVIFLRKFMFNPHKYLSVAQL